MIFISKNEKGEPAWKLILERKKTVTRRVKPLSVGKEFAVQPSRGKFAVCRVRVISCIPTEDWIENKPYGGENQIRWFDAEAKREGFISWQGLLDWFNKKKINILDTYRIEFKIDKVKGQDKDVE